MALPATRALVDYLRDDGRGQEEPDPDFIDYRGDPETVQMMEMGVRQRRKQMLLKKMLSDSGYDDLARMVKIKTRTHELDEDY